MTPKREQLEADRRAACNHEWESGGIWGVIIGVSRCMRCGVRSRTSDFTLGEALRQTGTEPPQPAEGA